MLSGAPHRRVAQNRRVQDDHGPRRSDGHAGYRWSAVVPGEPGDEEETVDYVRLDADEYAGPFRGRDGVITSTYEDMHAMLGISRRLYDDVMAWNDEAAALPRRAPEDIARPVFERQQELLRRLAAEVRPGIEVESARGVAPVRLTLAELVAEASAEPAHLQRLDVNSGRRTPLPPVPADLVRRIAVWIEDTYKGDDADEAGDEVVLAWQDEGAALARELGDVLGEDYVVSWS